MYYKEVRKKIETNILFQSKMEKWVVQINMVDLVGTERVWFKRSDSVHFWNARPRSRLDLHVKGFIFKRVHLQQLDLHVKRARRKLRRERRERRLCSTTCNRLRPSSRGLGSGIGKGLNFRAPQEQWNQDGSFMRKRGWRPRTVRWLITGDGSMHHPVFTHYFWQLRFQN